MFYVFPYEKIRKGSRIILYGLGNVGQCFLYELQHSNFCRLIALSDANAEKYVYDDVPVITPDRINNYDFDFVVIALNNERLAATISQMLLDEYGVPLDKIIFGCGRAGDDFDAIKASGLRSKIGCGLNGKTGISIAIRVGDGLGDEIIEKSFLMEFMKHTINVDCYVDIFVSASVLGQFKAIYSDCKFIRRIVTETTTLNMMYEYDVALHIGYFLVIKQIKLDKIRAVDEKFAQFLYLLKQETDMHSFNNMDWKNLVLHFARSEKLGYNCYSAYHYGCVMSVDDMHVDIPLEEKYWEKYKGLNLGKYLTINYGWGTVDERNRQRIPNKVWPLEYFRHLVLLFKEKYPNIEIVQVGLADSPKIPCVGRYLFGYDLEMVKFILQGSLLHIDCEGGLVHLATQLGTKCLVVFGPTPVHYFGYPQNINLEPKGCRNCYYLCKDYSQCFRGMDKPECMYSIKPERVMCAIESYIGKESERIG